MEDILSAPFLTEAVRTLTNIYRLGWAERNSGNLSLLLDRSALGTLASEPAIRRFPLAIDASALAGDCFLVTGAGKYFKNADLQPRRELGIVRISADGRQAELLWGLEDGGRCTSELSAHLLSHIARRRREGGTRVVLHAHPTNLLAMTYVHTPEPREFTRTLWRMCTECIMIFPDGVNTLPWMVCGTPEIGIATAQQMDTARLVVWCQHGVYAAGKDLDETFGLLETAEKAAEVYLKTAHLPRLGTITDAQLRQMAAAVGVTPRAGYLD